jgi:hypothetical protein
MGEVVGNGRIVLVLLLAGTLVPAPVAARDVSNKQLLAEYQVIRQSRSPLAGTLPVYLHTESEGDQTRVSLIGRISYPFSSVDAVLRDPAAYCEFLPLLFNVKACVITDHGPVEKIRYYVAGKNYAPPLASYRLNTTWRVLERRPDMLHVLMQAEQDRAGASSYQVDLIVIPSGEETLISVEAVYAPGRLTRAATHTYVHLFARNKPGFTLVEATKTGKREFITGFPAIIERSVVRSYLSLNAYLGTRKVAPDRRLQAQLQKWYSLNQPYHTQLHEMERDEYIAIKHRERRNQLKLQSKADQSATVKVDVLRLER